MVLQQVRIVIVCLDGLPQLVLQRAHLAPREIEAFWNFSILKQGKPYDLKSLRFCAPRPPKLPQAWQCCFGALSSAHHFYWAQPLSSTTVETVVTLHSVL